MVCRRRLRRSLPLRAAVVSTFFLLLLVVISNDVSFHTLPSGSLDQSDPLLHEIIRRDFLIHTNREPYNLKDPHISWFSQYQTEPVISKLLKNKKHGVFFEAGAYDGEFNTNSLYFERDLFWTGILVEPSVKNVEALKKKNRKALIVPACLSSYPYSVKVNFSHRGQLSIITDDLSPSEREFIPFYCLNGTAMVMMKLNDKDHQIIADELKCVPRRDEHLTQCLPLYSILQATGHTTIDFMTLDIEGTEMAVLRTIPFDKVDIKLMLIEVDKIEDPQILVDFMTSHNYKRLKTVDEHDLEEMLPNDMLFIKNELID